MSLFSHFLCDSVSPAYKPALTILCRKGDFHYNEITKDIDFSLNPMLFVSLPGELDQLRLFMHRYMTCVSLILCLSLAYQPLLCGLVGRDVCVPHFVSLTGVPAFIVRSCRERRVCPSFCLSPAYQPLLCGLVGRDVCVPHFVAYLPLLCGLVGRDVCVPHFVSLTGVPAFIVRSCRERRVCPSFCVSHRRTSLYCAVL